MNRFVLAAPAALALFCAQSMGAAKTPPPEYAAYVAAVRKADAIEDPLQRCLAYPDLPGNTWAPGLAKMRCTMFQTRTKYSLDEIEALLAQPGGAKTLEDHFQSLYDAQFGPPEQRSALGAGFSYFDSADDKAERVARAWLAASPGSAFARTALGLVLERRGWKARGTKYVQQTPPEQLAEMERLFGDAAKEFLGAMEAKPKLVPACIGLMEMGRAASSEVQAYASQRCLAIDPNSFSVVEEMMNAAEPRWGGSDAAMRSVAAYANARVKDNPLLALFEFDNAYYEISRMDDGDDQAIAVLGPGALRVPNASYLREAGGAYLRKGDEWKAFAYLSQALRFMPGYAQETRLRAIALDALGEPAWARADAERAVALDPSQGRAHLVLADIVRELGGPAAAIPHYQRAMEDSETRESASNGYCGSLIDAGQPEEAVKCLDALLAAYPENAEGWRQRVVAIGYDAPGAAEAMERYLALRDPQDSGTQATAETFRKLLAAKNGTASPEEAFDARMIRARAAERSPAGQAYYKRVQAGTADMMKRIFGTCQAALTKDMSPDFAAVMDVHPDGTIANAVVRPANAWSSCFAKQFEAIGHLPAPPEGFGEAGYPIAYAPRVRTATTTRTTIKRSP